jgi:hypothetical protein
MVKKVFLFFLILNSSQVFTMNKAVKAVSGINRNRRIAAKVIQSQAKPEN